MAHEAPWDAFRAIAAKAEGPPLGYDYRFGVKSSISEYTAASCIKGYYSLEDALAGHFLYVVFALSSRVKMGAIRCSCVSRPVRGNALAPTMGGACFASTHSLGSSRSSPAHALASAERRHQSGGSPEQRADFSLSARVLLDVIGPRARRPNLFGTAAFGSVASDVPVARVFIHLRAL